MANEFDQYTIKYNSEFKDFRDSALPKVGRGGVLGVAGAIAGAGLSIVLPFGAVVCAGVGFALAGPVSQVAYSSVYSAKNLSNRHFSKVKLPLEEAVASGLSNEDNAKRNILAVKKIAEACDKRARDYVSALNTTAGAKKYTIVDDAGKTIQVSERKLKKMIKENEEVARHALDYIMDVAIEQSNRYRAIDAGSIRVADKVTAMEFCMYMLQTAGQTASNLVQNRRTLGEVNPYKGTILRALQNKALIATKKGRLEVLPSHSITHADPSFNERINLNFNNPEEMLTLYNELYETEIRATLQREQEERNAEQVRINADKRKQIEAIETYIRALVKGERIKQARANLDFGVLNAIENSSLIKIAQMISPSLPEDARQNLQQAINELQVETSRVRKNPSVLAMCRNELSRLIYDSVKVIEATKFKEGAESRQAEIDELLGKLTAGEIEREHLSSLVTAYTRIINNLKRANAEEKANAEAEYLKLKDAYEASGTKNAQLEQLIAQLENSLSSTKRDLHLRNQENLRKVRQVIGARNEKIDELNNDIISQAERIRLLIQESKGKTLSIESLKQAITTLTNQLSTAVQNSKNDKTVIDELRTEIQNLSAELGALNISNPLQKKQIEELQALLSRKETELQNAMSASKKYQGTTVEAMKSNAKLKETIASQNSEITELNETILTLADSLKDAWDTANDKTSVYNNCVDKIKDLKRKLRELSESNSVSQQQIQELNKKIDKLEAENEKLGKTIGQKDTQIASLQSQLGGLQTKLDQLQTDYAALVGENGDLWLQINNTDVNVSSKIQELKDSLTKLGRQKKVDVDKIESLTKEIEELQDKLKLANSQNFQLQQKNEALKQAKDRLNAELKGKNISLDTLRKKIQELNSNEASDKVKIEALQAKVDELEDLHKQIVDALNDARSANTTKLSQQYEKFKELYNQAGVNDKTIETALDRMSSALKSRKDEPAITPQSVLEGLRSVYSEDFVTLIENSKVYDTALERLAEQFADAREKAKTQQTRAVTAEKKAKALRKANRELTTELATERGRFESEIAEVTGERDEAIKARDKTELEKAGWVAQTLREMDRADQAIYGAEETYENSVGLVENLYTTIYELMDELAVKDEEISDLRGQIRTVEHPETVRDFNGATKSLQQVCARLQDAVRGSIKASELADALDEARDILLVVDVVSAGGDEAEIKTFTAEFKSLAERAEGLLKQIKNTNAKLL